MFPIYVCLSNFEKEALGVIGLPVRALYSCAVGEWGSGGSFFLKINGCCHVLLSSFFIIILNLCVMGIKTNVKLIC